MAPSSMAPSLVRSRYILDATGLLYCPAAREGQRLARCTSKIAPSSFALALSLSHALLTNIDRTVDPTTIDALAAPLVQESI